MAVIKVFDSIGVKTVEMMGNLTEQPYDVIEEENISVSEDSEAEE